MKQDAAAVFKTEIYVPQAVKFKLNPEAPVLEKRLSLSCGSFQGWQKIQDTKIFFQSLI